LDVLEDFFSSLCVKELKKSSRTSKELF